jgi:hypothetical protein
VFRGEMTKYFGEMNSYKRLLSAKFPRNLKLPKKMPFQNKSILLRKES